MPQQVNVIRWTKIASNNARIAPAVMSTNGRNLSSTPASIFFGKIWTLEFVKNGQKQI